MGDLSESLVAKARVAYDQSNFEHSKTISLDCIKVMQQSHHHHHQSQGEHLCSQLTACFMLAMKSWASLAKDTKLEQSVTDLEDKLSPPTKCSHPVGNPPCLLSDFLFLNSSPGQFNGTLESFCTLATKADKNVENVSPLNDTFLLLRLCELCLDADLYDYALNFSLQLHLMTTRNIDPQYGNGTIVNVKCDATETNHDCPLLESESMLPSGLTEQVWGRLVQRYSSSSYMCFNGMHCGDPSTSDRVNHDVGGNTSEHSQQGDISLINYDDSSKQVVAELTPDELLIDECLGPSIRYPSTAVYCSTMEASGSHNDLSTNEESLLAHTLCSHTIGYLNNDCDGVRKSDLTVSERTLYFYDDSLGAKAVSSAANAGNNASNAQDVGDDILVIELEDRELKQESNMVGDMWTTSRGLNSCGYQDVPTDLSMIGDDVTCVSEQVMELGATFEHDDDDMDIKQRKSILKVSDKVPVCSDSPQLQRSATKCVRFSLDPTHPSPAVEAAYGGRSNRRRLLDFARRRQQFDQASAGAAATADWTMESDLYTTIISPLFSVTRYILHCHVVIFRILLGYMGTVGIHSRLFAVSSPLVTWGLLLVFFCSCGLLLFFCYGC